ncbi:transposase [Polyangium spumosum]|uniref:Transposase n=1 Tax=Polyangium spumosum TaxID=889282 RepID=A0A6N7PUC6_9BACT|nr:transposase [Polyangium spumosum]MRG95593.1 transposase [Polyangium spumosum]
MGASLDGSKRLRVLSALVDGNSERATARIAGVDRETVGRLSLQFGTGAVHLHNGLARHLAASLIQVDEIWSYVGKKQKRVTPEDPPYVGEAYTFVAMSATSRFVIGWHVGKRNEESARAFMEDVRARLCVMPSIVSDGFAPYIAAVGASFGPGVDYAQTVKNYSRKGRRDDDHRYEPAREAHFITKRAIFGAPDLETASTAYMERQNGTMRHHIGRMRRLSYAFSKRPENHRAAVSLAYVHYNMCHIVSTLRTTPGMAAHVTDHLWEMEELLDALMTAKPCDPPAKEALRHREPESPARELPGGRGFLRLVGGGKGAEPRPHVEPPPVAPVPVAAPVEPVADPTGQLDLFAWRPKPPPKGQLSLFPNDEPR